RRPEQRLDPVGIERQRAGIGRLDQHGNSRLRPVQAQVAQEGSEQNHVAEITSANDENLRWVGSGHWPPTRRELAAENKLSLPPEVAAKILPGFGRPMDH